LHIYNGYFPQKSPQVLGHEFMGVVAETGPRVKKLKRGDRVVVPFPIACGECWFCARELPAHCEKSNPGHYGPDGRAGKGGGLFGYTDEYGHYDGGQAEFVRVPYADFGPRRVPDGVFDDDALFLSDIIPTGWTAAQWCDIKPGDCVAVFGCGPVGLMAMKSARLMGAGRIVAVDPLRYRRELAARLAGAETVDPGATDAVEEIRGLTQGRGADACIDAVGLEADHGVLQSLSNLMHLTVGSINALKWAIFAARRGGAVSVIGVYGAPPRDFPLDVVFDKGLRMRAGQASVQPVIDGLMEMVAAGKLTAKDIVTHRFSLEEGPRAYRMFNDKEDGIVKTILKP
jgi:S-(hydroxymethyl)glutathione dehydrogenase/alcohol dehydrogenase